jgi:hypothetical protein
MISDLPTSKTQAWLPFTPQCNILHKMSNIIIGQHTTFTCLKFTRSAQQILTQQQFLLLFHIVWLT